MLDDANVIKQRDPEDALGVAMKQHEQATLAIMVDQGEYDGRPLQNVVVAGMGGSGLAASLLKSWLSDEIVVPFDIIQTYHLPAYIGFNTLVVISSYSGNTEEVISCLQEARERNAQVAIISSGGKLEAAAEHDSIAHVELPAHLQPRMSTIYQLRALTAILAHFRIINHDRFAELADVSDWLGEHTAVWGPQFSVDKNYAKQLALLAVGKTPVFYAGHLMAPIAYKWKISWNENAKNVAFWNELPEFNHNEFLGWASHPIEKPFAVFDLVSSFEHPRILKRFTLTDKLLSGKRPKSVTVELRGDSVIAQMLWASILADFVSIYVAILNGVDPTPVVLVEKLKKEMA